jgi:putative ABC transport system permease protein
MVISTLAINKQMHFINETDMGFDKNQVLMIQSPYSWGDKLKTGVLKDGIYHYAAMTPFIDDATS